MCIRFVLYRATLFEIVGDKCEAGSDVDIAVSIRLSRTGKIG